MAIDYALRRFCTYLIGSPHKNVIVADHLPLLCVFNGKRSGSIRTDRIRIKLSHQDILFYLKFGKGRNNPADYLSRHGTQWKSEANPGEREQSNDLSKLLYTLHVAPVLDALEIRAIAEHTQTNTTLT